MEQKITATPEQLVSDGEYTASSALARAKVKIDEQFGEGYAKSHPELVGHFICAAVSSNCALVTAQISERAAISQTDALNRIAEAIEEHNRGNKYALGS